MAAEAQWINATLGTKELRIFNEAIEAEKQRLLAKGDIEGLNEKFFQNPETGEWMPNVIYWLDQPWAKRLLESGVGGTQKLSHLRAVDNYWEEGDNLMSQVRQGGLGLKDSKQILDELGVDQNDLKALRDIGEFEFMDAYLRLKRPSYYYRGFFDERLKQLGDERVFNLREASTS